VVKVSMTTFVDFVMARGTRRITCVKDAKKQYSEGYSPARDFYRQLREEVVAVHYEGQPLSTLNTIVQQANVRKQDMYRKCVAGYKRWRGKKSLSSFPVAGFPWSQGQLEVSVNPELGLVVNGTQHLIKLYFKAGNPTKSQIDAALHLLEQHPACGKEGAIPAILDMQAGKLHVPTRTIPAISALLTGEAAAFVAMWDRL